MERRRERHRMEKAGWLRAAVLGADDGILSTASLVLGVAAADGSRSRVLNAREVKPLSSVRFFTEAPGSRREPR